MPSANKKNALLERWAKTLADGADKSAIFSATGEARRTFRQIEAESRDIESQLRDVAPGAVTALQMGNSASWPAALLAAFRRGLVPLPLGSHMERADLDAALSATGAAVLLSERNGAVRIEALQGRAELPERTQFLKLTSGTTSAPRAICFRSEQLVADCDNVCETMEFGRNDLNFGVIPFSHSYGFSNLITPLLCRGVPLVASHDRMPRAIADGLLASGATVFPGMPVFFQTLCGLENLGRFPQLRLCISAGAPLPVPVAESFSARFGLKIHSFYGSSECGGIAYDRNDAVFYEDGFVGTAMKNVELTLRDAEGDLSRLEVRSAAVGDGYFPEKDDALQGGCFRPGDLARKDARGLYLAGRVSDFINVAGRKLNPLEVEAQLLLMRGVRQAVVFGAASQVRHQAPVACVVLGPETDAAALERECLAKMSRWQVPRDFWAVESIPVNERGKINRRELAAAYERLQRDRRLR